MHRILGYLYVEDKGKHSSENDGIVVLWQPLHPRSHRRKRVNVMEDTQKQGCIHQVIVTDEMPSVLDQ